MSSEQTALEIIASTVNEAIARGLQQLGLPEEEVDIEVLDQGAKGLFGLGNRQARVKLMVKEKQPAAAETAIPAALMGAPVPAPISKTDDESYPVELARHVVEELITRMKVYAKVEACYMPSSSEPAENQIVVDIMGEDLSILIGRRSEVLNALQYITSLIVSKELGHWVPLLIDVQGYRTRREKQLRQLAKRMADQAVRSGRSQVLEPMSASERRIVHLELRDYPDIVTESVGDEPNRKVTIQLKR